MTKRNYLHVYPQRAPHDTVFIAGTPSALRLLRDAIDEALANGLCCETDKDLEDEFYAGDGEAYDLVVINWDDGGYWSWDKVQLPYTGEEWRDKRSTLSADNPMIDVGDMFVQIFVVKDLEKETQDD